MNFNVFYSWGQRFLHLRSEAKVKAGIFIGPQIKKIIECDEFANLLNRTTKTAWNYVQLVQTHINNYAKMRSRMSLKVHILDAHLHKFKDNVGAYSEKQSEQKHDERKRFAVHWQI